MTRRGCQVKKCREINVSKLYSCMVNIPCVGKYVKARRPDDLILCLDHLQRQTEGEIDRGYKLKQMYGLKLDH